MRCIQSNGSSWSGIAGGETGGSGNDGLSGGKHFLTAQLSGRLEGRSPGVMCVPGYDADFHVRPLTMRAPAWQLWECATSESWENTGHRMGTDLYPPAQSEPDTLEPRAYPGSWPRACSYHL